MSSTPPAGHTPARWQAKVAVLAAIAIAVGVATIPAFAASAEQRQLNQNILVATGSAHTTAISSPVLALPARYHYQTVTVPGYPSVYVNGISGSGGYAGEGCKDRNCTKVALFAASPAGKITFYTLPSSTTPRPDRSTPPRPAWTTPAA